MLLGMTGFWGLSREWLADLILRSARGCSEHQFVVSEIHVRDTSDG
jgi:hypothetical protein